MSKVPKGSGMITSLVGPNSYARKVALEKMVAEFSSKHGSMAIERLDGEETTVAQTKEALESISFLTPQKLVVLRTPSALKEVLQDFEDLFSDIPDSTKLIIIEPVPDKRSKYYGYLQKHTYCVQCIEPNETELVSWLMAEANRLGSKLSRADAAYIVGLVGNNQMALATEIEKLSLASEEEISRQIIDVMVEPTLQSTIFQLVESAFAGDITRTFRLYDEQRAQKVEPQAIIGMLAWQFHVLAVLITAGDKSDTQISADTNIKPFTLQKSRALVKRKGAKKIKQLIKDLYLLDVRSKSTITDVDDALKNYFIAMSR
jgi:DNA polymerase-3 subunit delta